MKRDRRTTIGLLISDVNDAFDSSIMKGVMQGAKEVDANLIMLPGRYLKAQYRDKERSRCDYQYNTIYSYATKQNVDVLLVLMGNIGTMMTEQEKKIFLQMYKGIPTILISDHVEGYPSLHFDNRSGLRDGMVDLIANKGCRKIGFVSGPLTSADAMERLDVYRETLKDYEIPVEEKKIVYGNFSEYSEEVVQTLLAENPDLEAIVFANDQMAIGGYKVLKEKGLRIGDDILIMGFDDSPAAIELVPNLTSVQASALGLGRAAAIEAVNYLYTKKIRNEKVKTRLIKRRSTGTKEEYKALSGMLKGLDQALQQDVLSIASQIVCTVFGENKYNSNNFELMISNWIVFVREFFLQVQKDSRAKSVGDMEALIEHTVMHTDEENFDSQKVFSLFAMLKDIMIENMAPERASEILDMLNGYMLHMTVILAQQHAKTNEEFARVLWMSNSIARDMLAYEEGSDKCYVTVADKLQRLGFPSAYIYAFPRTFINVDGAAWHDWSIPSKAALKVFYRDGEPIEAVPDSKQLISTMNVFDNPYMPIKERYDMVLNIVYINEEQMGLLLCQVDSRKIQYLTSIMAQLSSAFKIINMLNTQIGIQRELESSLMRIRENNQMLEMMSKQDELTGLLNRRGFFEKTNHVIKDARNRNKKAIVIYADLDNLKLINDQYGHEEGDFALIGVAEVLKDSMRASDVVARIGGDEYAALAIVENDIHGDMLKDRIKAILEKYNGTSNKDYYIGLSVGFAEFSISSGSTLEDYLEIADERLYEDKKCKRKAITK